MHMSNNPFDLGREVGNLLAEEVLAEQKKKRMVAVYAGRFQPFHAGHHSVYADMVRRFGKDNVYIATSNKVELPKSPFDFDKKQKIINRMFDIPEDKIVSVKSPFAPKEVLEKFDPETTTFVTAFSKKDAGRLGAGKYYRQLPDNSKADDLETFKDKGYYYVAPVHKLEIGGQNISGTQVRKMMGSSELAPEQKKKVFERIYGKFDPEIFKMVVEGTTKAEQAKKQIADKEAGEKKEKEDRKGHIENHGDKKIMNPETKRLIFVKTALSYDKSHPVHQAAMQALKTEGVNDPGILKAVLLAGGPGSGKSYAAKQLFGIPDKGSYSESGMKVVNSDRMLEFLLKKYGYGTNLDKMQSENPELYLKITSDDPSSVRSKAKRVTDYLRKRYMDERLGMIEDGTGRDFDKVDSQKKALEDAGYDVKIVYIDTPLEVAQQRNANRERKLAPRMVERLWKQTKANQQRFVDAYGENNVLTVDNSGPQISRDVMKIANRHAHEPIHNPKGRQWIAIEKRKKQEMGKTGGAKKSGTATSGKKKSGIDPNARVKNPKTNRQILVKTALSYDKSHPAYRAAASKMKEDITIPVNVGDTVLMSKFKNKKTVIKSIGEDDYGMPTINGKKVATFRMIADDLQESMDPDVAMSGLSLGMMAMTIMGKEISVFGPKIRKAAQQREPELKRILLKIQNNPNFQKLVHSLPNLSNAKQLLGVGHAIIKTIIPQLNTQDKNMILSYVHSESVMEDFMISEADNIKKLAAEYNLVGEGMISRVLLMKEGGAAGHMAHPFDDMDLTFGDLKKIVELGLEGNLNVEAPVTEKLDGQNISVSYREDNGVIFARNMSHTKNRGLNAMNVDGVKQMFAGRGELSIAFSGAAEDLEKAILALSPTQLEKTFADGSKFMSIEILLPVAQNVIPYGHNMLVLHNTIEYDDSGKAIGTDGDSGRTLAGMIKQVNQNIQKTFQFSGPIVVQLPKSKNFGIRKGVYNGRITKLQNQFGLKDSDRVMMWHQRWWEDFIQIQARKYRFNMSNNVFMGLLQRWAFQNMGGYTVANMKRTSDNEMFLQWAMGFDKTGKQAQFKSNIAPFERLFLQLGAEILQNASGLLSASPDEGAQQLRKELEKLSNELARTGDVNQLSKFKEQLAKLNSIGVDKIIPTEGIVFVYRDKVYKLTGTFAPLNQLLGIVKYGR